MLPYVDDFLPMRNLANLEMIVRKLRTVDWQHPVSAATIDPNGQY